MLLETTEKSTSFAFIDPTVPPNTIKDLLTAILKSDYERPVPHYFGSSENRTNNFRFSV